MLKTQLLLDKYLWFSRLYQEGGQAK